MADRPQPLLTPSEATVMVVAAQSDRGRALAARIGRAGCRALGPWPDEATARSYERALRPDLCALVLPPIAGRTLVHLTPRLADRRETRGLVVRLAEPFADAELAAGLELALARAAELRTIEREASDPRAVIRDLDALARAKAILTHELPMTERHASERLRAAAGHGERLADVARRVWRRRGSLAPAPAVSPVRSVARAA